MAVVRCSYRACALVPTGPSSLPPMVAAVLCSALLVMHAASGAAATAAAPPLGCPKGDASQQQSPSGAVAIQLGKDKQSAVLSNGYVCVVLGSSAVVELRSDFHGKGDYGLNALAEQFGLVVPAAAPTQRLLPSATITEAPSSGPEARVVTMHIAAPIQGVNETWTISVGDRQRGVSVRIAGRRELGGSRTAGTVNPIAAPRHVIAAAAVSTFAQFDRGAMQMMNRDKTRRLYTNSSTLRRIYWLGAKNITQAARAIPKPYPTVQLPCLDVKVNGTSLLAIESAPDGDTINPRTHESEHLPGGSLLDFIPGSSLSTVHAKALLASSFPLPKQRTPPESIQNPDRDTACSTSGSE